ncbi:MAG TPA: hypothetical protein VFK05_01915 [Polyangiaceae bacterium]|nr:hypothetical protein [Polyangiaceae bacterium]
MSSLERLRDRLIAPLQKRSVLSVIRLACWVALVGLAVMVASILYPAPLPVIFAMSIGQVIGIAAFVCYLLSILMDVIRGSDHAPDAPGPAKQYRKNNPNPDVTNST